LYGALPTHQQNSSNLSAQVKIFRTDVISESRQVYPLEIYPQSNLTTMSIMLYSMYSFVYCVYTKENTLTLGNHLRKYRFNHNEITQQDLANAVGVTRLTIHSIEKGKFNPSALLALKIVRFFKVKFEDIFYLVEERAEE